MNQMGSSHSFFWELTLVQGAQATENRALDALLAGLSAVVKQAASELGCYATEEAIVARATKQLNCTGVG